MEWTIFLPGGPVPPFVSSTAFFKLEADSRKPTGPISCFPRVSLFPAWALDFKSFFAAPQRHEHLRW
jgi:hypothetical protein